VSFGRVVLLPPKIKEGKGLETRVSHVISLVEIVQCTRAARALMSSVSPMRNAIKRRLGSCFTVAIWIATVSLALLIEDALIRIGKPVASSGITLRTFYRSFKAQECTGAYLECLCSCFVTEFGTFGCLKASIQSEYRRLWKAQVTRVVEFLQRSACVTLCVIVLT